MFYATFCQQVEKYRVETPETQEKVLQKEKWEKLVQHLEVLEEYVRKTVDM